MIEYACETSTKTTNQLRAISLWWRHLVNACEVMAGPTWSDCWQNLAPSVSGSYTYPSVLNFVVPAVLRDSVWAVLLLPCVQVAQPGIY